MKLLKMIMAVSFLFVGKTIAQNSEFGKVTLKELQETVYSADTAATAAIVFTKGRTYFKYTATSGFYTCSEYEFRIKIYKSEGLKWANFEVPFYVGYNEIADDHVKFSDGVTYNLEDGQIVKTKLSGEGTFRKDVNQFWNVASVAMPNVKAGSIIEFKYTHRSYDLGDFPQFYFQYDIPVKYAEYRTEVPEFFIYKPITIGFGEVKSDVKIVNGYQNFSNKHQQTVNMTFQQINSSYIAQNVPALRKEPYVDNMENYRSSIINELERTRFPDQPVKNYSIDWQGVTQTIFKDDKFLKELEERHYFEQDLPAVLRNKTTDQEKAIAVLQHVKRTVKWDGKYGYRVSKGVRKAYLEKVGNVAEVNFILISMLNLSGIKANPVLISTINHGIPVYPNMRIFNSVIAAVEIDGQKVLLDATDQNATLDILPLRDLNWNGRLIRRDGGSEEIALVPHKHSRENINLMYKIGAQGQINGMARIQKTDYIAYNFRDKLGKLNQQEHVENLEHHLGEIEISDYTAENIEDLDKPITETFNFVTDNHVEIIAGKMYVDPLLFFTQNTNPFVMEERKLPIYYGYPTVNKYNVILEVPEGYALESMPTSINLLTEENVGQFAFNIVNKGTQIQIAATVQVNAAMISADFYGHMKAFYQQMIDKQKEKIVLTKK